MKESIIAKVYAKSLMELGVETGDDIVKEFTDLETIINANNNLENLLFLEVFSIEEKFEVLSFIFEKLNTSKLFKNFILYLSLEDRINYLPLIFKEVIVLDDFNKGFIRGQVSSDVESLNESSMNAIKNYLKNELKKEIILDYNFDREIVGGIRVKADDLMFDATVNNILNNIKNYILQESEE